MSLDLEKEWSAEELRSLIAVTKSTPAGADLALKDATTVYHNGPVSGGHVNRAIGHLRKLRALNGVDIPVAVIDTVQVPRGGMVYMAGGQVFAFGLEAKDTV